MSSFYVCSPFPSYWVVDHISKITSITSLHLDYGLFMNNSRHRAQFPVASTVLDATRAHDVTQREYTYEFLVRTCSMDWVVFVGNGSMIDKGNNVPVFRITRADACVERIEQP
mgnify:FL=1